MASRVYWDSYRKYKSGTKQVLHWLLDTSGHEVVEAAPRPNDWPGLAMQVMSKLSPADVPQHILTVIGQVIAARKECSAHHASKTARAGLHNASNDTHAHFVGVLQMVQQILLGPLAQRAAGPRKATEEKIAGDAKFVRLANRFAGLELQEPAERLSCIDDSRMDAVDDVCSSADGQLRTDLDPNGLSERNDGTFASFCFLLDCHRVRNYLRTVWNEYKHHKVSLISASLTTNLAFDLIHQLHVNLCDAFPQYTTYEFLDQASSNQSDRPIDNYDCESPSPGWTTFGVLRHFLEGYREGRFEDYDSENDGYDSFASDTNQEDPELITTTLVRTIPDIICFVEALGGINFPIDQMSCQLWYLYNSKKLPVPLVIACEIFMDIHCVLSDELSRSFSELQASTTRANTAMKRSQIHSRQVLKADRTTVKTQYTLEALQTIINLCVTKDAVAEFRAEHIKPLRKCLQPYYMVRHHPILCGSLQFHVERTMYYGGLRACNEWGCLIGIIHLYNAAQQSGHLLMEWPDLELIIQSFTAEYLFVGERPTGPEEYVKRHAIAMGMSVAEFAPDSLTKRRDVGQDAISIKTSRRSARLLEVRQPLLTIIRERYSVRHGKKDTGSMVREVGIAIEALKTQKNKSSEGESVLSQWRAHQALDPVKMLTAILRGIQDEEKQLRFDFLNMNIRCLEVLRHLRDRFIQEFPASWSMRTLENSRLESVVSTILYCVAQNEDCRDVYLNIVGQVLAGTILREGSQEVNRLGQNHGTA